MWASTTSPPHWRHSGEGSATIVCEESPLKGSSDESILLQGPIGLGSGEEDVLQTEKPESEGEGEYTEETVVAVPAETATDADNNCGRHTDSNCFSLVRVAKPEPELPLPSGGQNDGLLGCQDAGSTDHGLPEGSRLPADGTTLPQKLKISSTVTRETTHCHAPASDNDTPPPCSASPTVSSTAAVLPYAIPLGSSAGTIGPGTSGCRSWTYSPPRLPMVSIGGEARGPSIGSVGCFISSVFLGTNGHTPVIPGGAAVASSALPATVGNRFSGMGGPSLLPTGFSLGGNTVALNSWPQHPKQQQQQAAYVRPHVVPPAAAQPSGNIPVILIALRRHLRALIRIMYNKHLERTHADSLPVQTTSSFQKEDDPLLYPTGTGGGCGVSVSFNEEHASSACGLKCLMDGGQAEYAQCSAAMEIHELPATYKNKVQGESLMATSKESDELRGSPSVCPQMRPPSPQDGGTESQEDLPEAPAVPNTPSRGTAPIQLAGSSRDSLLPHLGSVDGAAESWEGQRCFHEEHLDACSLSELSDYLQIFSSFLSLSLSEVSRQEPATLQHIRLQLLLLRNSHQQQPDRFRQAKQILQRWPPSVRSPTVGGPDADDDGSSLNSCAEATISPADVCLRNASSGASRPSIPFSSTNLCFLSSFPCSPNSHVDTDAPYIATSAVCGRISASGSTVSTGECESGVESTGVRNAEFPSSSVDAFSVDGPPSSSSNATAINAPPVVGDCPVQPTVHTTFVAGTTSEQPSGAAVIPPCKDKLQLPWNPDCGGTPGQATAPAAGLRWSPLSGTAIGIRLQSLIGGASLGMGSTLSLSGSSGGGAIQHGTETATGAPLSTNGCCGVGALLEGGTATLALSPGPLEWIRDGTTNGTNNQPMGVPVSPYVFFSNGHCQTPDNSLQFVKTAQSARGSSGGCPTSPADLGLVISADGLGQGRAQRGNVQVTFSPQLGAWVVCCARGLLQQSRAFSVATLGFEGAKKTAQQYATHCRRQCSSKRASDRGGKGKGGETREESSRGGSRGSKDTNRKAGSAVTPIPQVTIGLAGPPGGAFNLAKSSNQEFILPKSDFSASRVARLSRRAMELPYVHGVRFEAANFAWVAQMRGEARRFLVKKHGFVKSRLCAIEKIEMWRAALSPEALASELKAEQDVLAMVPNMCPEEAYPEAMQAVEESLRLKFQRGTIMSCRSNGNASIGLKRQRNPCLETERETSKANRSHDTFFEQLLVQQQQVMSAQHLVTQPSSQPDGQRQQFQLPQTQFMHPSQHQIVESPHQHILAQDHLLRSISSPASTADPAIEREAPEQMQQQQMVLPVQGFRTRGQQQQQLLSQQFPSALSTLPGISLQHQTVGASNEQTRAAPE